MALQTSGQISISDIAAEFGASAPYKMSDFYRGGDYVPDTSANSNVPTSGAIKASDFYGASNITSDDYTLTVGADGSEYGYRSGQYGALSPTTLKGETITDLYSISGESEPTTLPPQDWVIIAGNHAKEFFQKVEIQTSGGTVTLETSTATHNYNSSANETSWRWAEGALVAESGSKAVTFYY